MARELFGDANALGETVRIGGGRYRVVGVMRPKGSMIGFDLDDTVYIPSASALELFNREGLFEIHVHYEERAPVDELEAGCGRVLIDRHGDEDFTIRTSSRCSTRSARCSTCSPSRWPRSAASRYWVGAVGIFTIMTIAVRERTGEIRPAARPRSRPRAGARGVPRRGRGAIDARRPRGLAVGGGLAWLLGATVPALPVSFSPLFVVLSLALAVLIGLVAGILPAMNAARLDPVEALRAE